MTLFINGTSMNFDTQKNIQEILEALDIESKIIAIALNSNLVKREDYKSTFPNNGDRIEFLQFMGGG
ncbi:thiamine biosynthesis protein ThiS [Helicobacter sp. 16-1353]|uniref:sulfur carrier protein ThiS n=1 Tax=Helicobacter sp. 16-1353 TaxID=2004996 RepID=UPI000DCDDE1C|nr:sulfur carrier protein ThiS [Helicobacter sp. 16-1353]RAX54383.1 thiamine biosynthesis protein ThiS [Helicobacter sp. 16-1353]